MMVYKCCTVNCLPNCNGGESKTVFSFSKREYLKTGRTKFFYRKVRESISFSYICIRYFEEKYYKKGKNSKYYGLAMNMKPVPTILDPKTVISKNSQINNVTLLISIPRRSGRKPLHQENQYEFCISARTQLKALHA